MLTAVFAVIGIVTVAGWVLPILFPRTVLKIRLALFAVAMAKLLQAQADRMQRDQDDPSRP